jgi:hypothetical protein
MQVLRLGRASAARVAENRGARACRRVLAQDDTLLISVFNFKIQQ